MSYCYYNLRFWFSAGERTDFNFCSTDLKRMERVVQDFEEEWVDDVFDRWPGRCKPTSKSPRYIPKFPKTDMIKKQKDD